MRPILRLGFSALLVCCLLTACGKKGAPHAPGPDSKITYPHVYPPE